jgi:hypothetical protein
MIWGHSDAVMSKSLLSLSQLAYLFSSLETKQSSLTTGVICEPGTVGAKVGGVAPVFYFTKLFYDAAIHKM